MRPRYAAVRHAASWGASGGGIRAPRHAPRPPPCDPLASLRRGAEARHRLAAALCAAARAAAALGRPQRRRHGGRRQVRDCATHHPWIGSAAPHPGRLRPRTRSLESSCPTGGGRREGAVRVEPMCISRVRWRGVARTGTRTRPRSAQTTRSWATAAWATCCAAPTTTCVRACGWRAGGAARVSTADLPPKRQWAWSRCPSQLAVGGRRVSLSVLATRARLPPSPRPVRAGGGGRQPAGRVAAGVCRRVALPREAAAHL